jgi:hypothetical protein
MFGHSKQLDALTTIVYAAGSALREGKVKHPSMVPSLERYADKIIMISLFALQYSSYIDMYSDW